MLAANPVRIENLFLASAIFFAGLAPMQVCGTEKLQVKDDVEVYYLNEWRPGVVQMVDKNGNAKVTFEFAASAQTQVFNKNAIRFPCERDAIARMRNYSDKSGKFKISAALLGMSDTEIRLRKKDMKELKVPIEKLSEPDQAFLKKLKKEVGDAAKDGFESGDGYRPWFNLLGKKIAFGKIVNVNGLSVTIESKDGKKSEIDMTTLSPGDRTLVHEFMSSQGDQAFNKARDQARESSENIRKDIEKSREEMKQANADMASRFSDMAKGGNMSGTPKDTLTPEKQISFTDQEFWNVQPDTFVHPKLADSFVLKTPESGLPCPPRQFVTADRKTKWYACVSTDTEFKNSMEDASRLVLYQVDLVTGKPMGENNTIPGRCRLQDLSPNGSQFLVFNDTFGPASGSLGLSVYRLDGNSEARCTWSPFSRTETIKGYFVDEDHVITVGVDGNIAMWDLNSLKIQWWAKARNGFLPGLSPNRKQLFLQTLNQIAVIDTKSGKVLGQKKNIPIGNHAMSCNDQGTRLVGVGTGTVRVWDLANGALLAYFAVDPIVGSPMNLVWANEHVLLVEVGMGSNGYEVVDTQRQFGIGYLDPQTIFASLGNQSLWATSIRKERKQELVMHKTTVPQELLQTAAKMESKLAINLHRGSRVAIDLTVAPGGDKERELELIKRMIADAGFEYTATNPEATFFANFRNPPDYSKVKLEDLPDDAFKANQTFGLKVGGKTIWRAKKDIAQPIKGNRWAGYVLPQTIRLSSIPLDLYGMMPDGKWKTGKMVRNYEDGQESYSHQHPAASGTFSPSFLGGRKPPKP